MSTAPTTETPARPFPLEHGTYKLEVLNLEIGESPEDFRGEVHVIGGAHAGRKCWVTLPDSPPDFLRPGVVIEADHADGKIDNIKLVLLGKAASETATPPKIAQRVLRKAAPEPRTPPKSDGREPVEAAPETATAEESDEHEPRGEALESATPTEIAERELRQAAGELKMHESAVQGLRDEVVKRALAYHAAAESPIMPASGGDGST